MKHVWVALVFLAIILLSGLAEGSHRRKKPMDKRKKDEHQRGMGGGGMGGMMGGGGGGGKGTEMVFVNIRDGVEMPAGGIDQMAKDFAGLL
jgi:uncharacterized membrane protein YfcA